jgi:hypothetical protein
MHGTGHLDVSWRRKEESGENYREKFVNRLVLEL